MLHGAFGSDMPRETSNAKLLAALKEQIEAGQAVIDNWETGDLAGAVNALDATIRGAREEFVSA